MKLLCLLNDLNHIQPIVRCRAELNELGISLTFVACDSGTKAARHVSTGYDAILIHQLLMSEEIIAAGVPVIILERIDGAQLAGSRPWLPRVAGVIKGYAFRDRQLNNHIAGRWFPHKLVEAGVGPTDNTRALHDRPVPMLSTEDLAKIRVSYGFPSYEMMGSLIANKPDMAKARPLDLHWVGTVTYQGTEIELHRKQATEIAIAWPGPKVVAEGRPYEYYDYKAHIRTASCVLSPWGWGEPCWRDVEAWLSGAVLIKPNTDYVESWPDMYRDGVTYRACKPDLSDVHEIVADVIARWNDHLSMRLLARKLCIDAWQPQAVAQDMAQAVRSLINANG